MKNRLCLIVAAVLFAAPVHAGLITKAIIVGGAMSASKSYNKHKMEKEQAEIRRSDSMEYSDSYLPPEFDINSDNPIIRNNAIYSQMLKNIDHLGVIPGPIIAHNSGSAALVAYEQIYLRHAKDLSKQNLKANSFLGESEKRFTGFVEFHRHGDSFDKIAYRSSALLNDGEGRERMSEMTFLNWAEKMTGTPFESGRYKDIRTLAAFVDQGRGMIVSANSNALWNTVGRRYGIDTPVGNALSVHRGEDVFVLLTGVERNPNSGMPVAFYVADGSIPAIENWKSITDLASPPAGSKTKGAAYRVPAHVLDRSIREGSMMNIKPNLFWASATQIEN